MYKLDPPPFSRRRISLNQRRAQVSDTTTCSHIKINAANKVKKTKRAKRTKSSNKFNTYRTIGHFGLSLRHSVRSLARRGETGRTTCEKQSHRKAPGSEIEVSRASRPVNHSRRQPPRRKCVNYTDYVSKKLALENDPEADEWELFKVSDYVLS